MTPGELRDALAFIQQLRPDPSAPFDALAGSHLPGADRAADAAVIAEWEAAGATW